MTEPWAEQVIGEGMLLIHDAAEHLHPGDVKSVCVEVGDHEHWVYAIVLAVEPGLPDRVHVLLDSPGPP